MPHAPDSWIALDVGGANIKAAHASGTARSRPFELWKSPDELGRVLAALLATFPASGRLALTMTAELCDCYPTKAAGVQAVLDAVCDAFGGRPVHVWGVDGRFHPVADVRARPEIAAASNWLALATVAARLVPEGTGLLIDIGTTTTDLIPIRDGRVAARGRTDTERLQTGELLYAGVRRTPVCALATELPFRDKPTGLAAELFASTLDVYLTLGEIAPDPEDRATADGRPSTSPFARDRLARMIGADRVGFSDADARAFAGAADEALAARLEAAAGRACGPTVGRPRSAVVSGSGAFLARRLARRVVGPEGVVVDLEEAWGPVASAAGCAHALLVLAIEGEGLDRVTRPVVIKVGGSLLDWPGLPGRLSAYLDDRRADRPVLIVGGGRAADVVRDLDRIHGLGERRSHALALRALDLSAHLLAALLPTLFVVDDPARFEPEWDARRVPVLAPRRFLEAVDAASDDPLPHSWRVTTDSIAARVAILLDARELVLLKSVGFPPATTRAGAARLGLVDPAFPDVARPLASVLSLNLRDPHARPCPLPDGVQSI